MKVKCTQPMTRELKIAFPEYYINLIKMTQEEFTWYVDCCGYHEEDFVNGKYQVIKVSYPDTFYSMPKYLTTYDLRKAFHRSDRTLKGFIEELRQDLEV